MECFLFVLYKYNSASTSWPHWSTGGKFSTWQSCQKKSSKNSEGWKEPRDSIHSHPDTYLPLWIVTPRIPRSQGQRNSGNWTSNTNMAPHFPLNPLKGNLVPGFGFPAQPRRRICVFLPHFRFYTQLCHVQNKESPPLAHSNSCDSLGAKPQH